MFPETPTALRTPDPIATDTPQVRATDETFQGNDMKGLYVGGDRAVSDLELLTNRVYC